MKKSDSVRTPEWLLDMIKKEFGEFYDPTPFNPDFNPLKDKDALKTDWGPVNFCNPPYSNVGPFMRKGNLEWRKGKTVIMLVKLDNLGTNYSRRFVKGAELRVLSEKISFPGYQGKARFSSVLLIWRAGKKSTRYSVL